MHLTENNTYITLHGIMYMIKLCLISFLCRRTNMKVRQQKYIRGTYARTFTCTNARTHMLARSHARTNARTSGVLSRGLRVDRSLSRQLRSACYDNITSQKCQTGTIHNKYDMQQITQLQKTILVNRPCHNVPISNNSKTQHLPTQIIYLTYATCIRL